MKYCKRGVSVIIGALLLVALAVAAAVLFYVYAIGLMGQMQATGGQQTKQQLILETYDWTTPSVLVLHLRNVGTNLISLTTADFFVKAQASTWTMNCPSGLQPQASCVVSLTVPNAIEGVAYHVKIVTADGATFSFSAVCGQTG